MVKQMILKNLEPYSVQTRKRLQIYPPYLQL